MSIPQFKLEVVNGKLIRVPIKNIRAKAPPRDPEFEKIKGKFDFENLQRQLELDDRTDIIQDLDPATRRIIENKGLSVKEAMALQGRRSNASTSEKLSKKDFRYKIIRENVDIDFDDGTIRGIKVDKRRLKSTVRGLVGETSNNKIDVPIGNLIFQELRNNNALRPSDWTPTICYKIYSRVNVYSMN